MNPLKFVAFGLWLATTMGAQNHFDQLTPPGSHVVGSNHVACLSSIDTTNLGARGLVPLQCIGHSDASFRLMLGNSGPILGGFRAPGMGLNGARANPPATDLVPALDSLPMFPNHGASTNPNSITCNNAWWRSRVVKSGNYRATLGLVFNQSPLSGYNWSAFSMSVRVQKRNWIGLWRDKSPSSITAAGSFSGPRSPRLQSGALGYDRPNPFTNVAMQANTQLRHFQDWSSPALACYGMTRGTYSVTVVVDGVTLYVPITW